MLFTERPKCVVVVVTAAVGRRPSASLEEVHHGEVDPLSGQRVHHPRTAGRPDRVPAAAGAADVDGRAGDEASRRTGCRRVTRHPAPITATPPGRRRRRSVAAAASASASVVH